MSSAMRALRFLALILVLPLLMAAGDAKLSTFDKGEITITSANGAHKFTIELAVSDAQREQGLMFRRQMPADAGMIFVWDTPQPLAMWMENTVIPLDMLFLNSCGMITGIHERAVPFSRDTISSDGPAKYVIELNGGIVSRLGIKKGDKVTGSGLSGRSTGCSTPLAYNIGIGFIGGHRA